MNALTIIDSRDAATARFEARGDPAADVALEVGLLTSTGCTMLANDAAYF